MPNTSRTPVFLWLAAGLIACVIGLYFRMYPLTHNVSSDAYEQGTMFVIAKVRAAVTAQVTRQFPDMPAAERDQLIKQKFDQTLREHRIDIQKAFDEAGQKISQNSADNKHYLLEVDAYYFLSLTEEVLKKGSFGTKTEGSKFFNPMMLAPVGYWQPQTWHPYIGALIYKIVHFFRPDTDVMFGVGWTAVALFPLVLAAFFFACRSLGCSLFPAFIAAVFFVLAPIYLQRSTFANFKDDAYNMFFPLLILGLLFQSLERLKDIKRSALFALLIALSLALYAQFWAGWGFVWGLSTGSLAGITALAFIKDRPLFKPALLFTTALTLIPFIVIGFIFGFNEVWQMILFALGELQKFIAPSLKSWPDMFIVVGELKKCSLTDVIELTGGPIMFFGGVCALIWAGIRALFVFDTKTAKTVILGAFFAVTLLLALSAQRFNLLCLTPLSLLFAFGLEELWSRRHSIAEAIALRSDLLKKIFACSVAGALLLSLIMPIMVSNKEIRSRLSPIFNSAWERALTRLRNNTPENSVINTWWSPGHFVKAIAKRRVTFDGASIKGEQAYWLTKVYLSQTEEEALGILRMLNVSSNNAAEYLQKEGLPLSTIVPLLTRATLLSRDDAHRIYTKAFSQRVADELIKMTHGTPPPSYVLIYNEIVDGNVLLGYVGKWDFKRIEDLNKNPKALKKIPGRNSENYVNFIWSLVGGPYRQSPVLNPAGHSGSTVFFDQGVSLDTSNMTITVKSAQYGTGIPSSVFYAEGDEVKEKTQANATLPYCAVLFKESNGAPRCVLLDRAIAGSLIAKMYYFEGAGLKHFKKFTKETDLTGRTKIFIYEVIF